MAQLIINVPDNQVARIQAAFGTALETKDENGVPRPATINEVKAYIIADVKQIIKNAEKRVYSDSYAAVPEPELTL